MNWILAVLGVLFLLALLLPAGYDVPLLSGQATLPASLLANAVAATSVTRRRAAALRTAVRCPAREEVKGCE